MRWCLDWLAQLERGEMVVVNLRPDTEDTTEFVRLDQARVRRVLAPSFNLPDRPLETRVRPAADHIALIAAGR